MFWHVLAEPWLLQADTQTSRGHGGTQSPGHVSVTALKHPAISERAGTILASETSRSQQGHASPQETRGKGEKGLQVRARQVKASVAPGCAAGQVLRSDLCCVLLGTPRQHNQPASRGHQRAEGQGVLPYKAVGCSQAQREAAQLFGTAAPGPFSEESGVRLKPRAPLMAQVHWLGKLRKGGWPLA